jgi:hypothetical protein
MRYCSFVVALFSASYVSDVAAQESIPRRTSTVTVTVAPQSRAPTPQSRAPGPQSYAPAPGPGTNIPPLDNYMGTRNSNPYDAPYGPSQSNPYASNWDAPSPTAIVPVSRNPPGATGWPAPAEINPPRPGSPWDSLPASPRRSTSAGRPTPASSSRGALGLLAAPTARVEGGIIAGSTIRLPVPAVRINQFLGVPFSDHPKRWYAPGAVPRWLGRYDATKTKPACMQQFNGKCAVPSISKAWLTSISGWKSRLHYGCVQ